MWVPRTRNTHPLTTSSEAEKEKPEDLTSGHIKTYVSRRTCVSIRAPKLGRNVQAHACTTMLTSYHLPVHKICWIGKDGPATTDISGKRAEQANRPAQRTHFRESSRLIVKINDCSQNSID